MVDAALAILDEHGADAITMRAVAERMHASAPTVYWTPAARTGCLTGSTTARNHPASARPALGRAAPLPRPQHPQLALTAHRDAARIAIGRFPLGPHGLRLTESALAALADAGLGDEDAAHAAYLFFGYVSGFCYQETVPPAPSAAADRTEALRLVGEYLSALPAADFPHLTRCAAALARPGLDRRFTFGLDRLLRGLAPATASSRPRP